MRGYIGMETAKAERRYDREMRLAECPCDFADILKIITTSCDCDNVDIGREFRELWFNFGPNRY
jgi:hypothetical protein